MTHRVYAVKFSVVLVIVLGFLLTLTNQPAHAASISAKPHTLTVPLTVDCAHVPQTSAAQAVLKQHHLCAYQATSSQVAGDAILPNTTVYGDCGSLSLTVDDNYNKTGQWIGTITSNVLPITSASISGSWYNYDSGVGGTVAGGSGGLFTYSWTYSTRISTGDGLIFGEVSSAADILLYGILCTNAGFPYDYISVTG